jgi:hypothetical protein
MGKYPQSRRDGRCLLFYDTHRMRIVDVIGAGLEARVDLGDAVLVGDGNDPLNWTSTVVEVGGGTTELSSSITAGIIGRITNAANENDGGSYQAPTSPFTCVAGSRWYAGIDFTSSEETEIDMFFGVAVTDTALLGGVADACYMETLDGGTGISCVNELSNAETQTDDLGTMVTTRMYWEMYWDGTSVHYFINGSEVLDEADGECNDQAMRLSLEFLNGEAVAHTLDIHSCRGFAWVP